VADPKQEESFKVVDRRLFTEEGELRKEAIEEERRQEEADKKAASRASTSKPAGGGKPGAPTTGGSSSLGSTPSASSFTVNPTTKGVAAGAISAPAEQEESEETVQPSHSFQMLVDFLTRNAAAMLGGVADPRTGKAFVDLEGAREMIDMLDALREKTKGNLAKADEELLIEVIGSLKLTFMEISQAAAEAMAKQAANKK